jgi:hypothetical protein
MEFPKDSSLVSVIKNQDLTLELEIPLEPSGSCSSSLNISMGPVKIPLGTSTQAGPICGVFTRDSIETGNALSQDTTGDPAP